jgi:L-arabinose 1-dehydrogenase
MVLRVGIVGLGAISTYFVAAIQRSDDFTLAAVCDRDEMRLATIDGYRVKHTTDYREVLAARDVDAVVVTTSNDQHFAICADALRAGKHVCCEKPLTADVADAAELVRLSMETGSTLFTAFHRRYNRNFDRVRALRPPQIDRVVVHYLERIEDHMGPDGWYLDPSRCGGGCVADNGPNVFDVSAYLLGPLEVTDADLKYRDGIDIAASIQLRSDDDVPVTMILDWAYEYGERKTIALCGTVVDFLDGFTEFKSSLYHEYEGIMEDFAKRIASGTEHGAEGLAAVRFVDATYALARTRTAVNL